VYRPENDTYGTLMEVVSHAVSDLSFANPAMDDLVSDGSNTREGEFKLGSDIFAIDDSNAKIRIDGFRVKVLIERRSSPIKLKSLNWKGAPVAFGSSNSDIGKLMVAVVEGAEGELSERLIVDGKQLADSPHSRNTR
jgi:hypothetical protein